jgi:hypothetical protein
MNNTNDQVWFVTGANKCRGAEIAKRTSTFVWRNAQELNQ